MKVIPEAINDRKLWVIICSRNQNPELEITKPIVQKLNEEWFKKGDFVWTGRFDDNKTSMTIFEATKDKADNYFEKFAKAVGRSLDVKLYKWDALPLFSILERIQKKI